MAAGFSLKDHLFNAHTVGQLAQEFAQGVPGFDPDRFARDALGGFANRELMARLDWLADCAQSQLPSAFPAMATALERAMGPPLDPTRTDDDFGHFIHAVPGILAVRHGLEDHRDRALELLYRATQRFSMEYYVRPFLNRWPDQTLARMAIWVTDDNYHVRRLVSEGTRPKLPWAKAVTLTQDQTLPLLDQLHADETRYVTRSVSNHLNDIAKIDANAVLGRLTHWAKLERQDPQEMVWMTRHSLRTLIKQGHSGAMAVMGYSPEAPVDVKVTLSPDPVIIGDALTVSCVIRSAQALPVLVDYRIAFARPDGKRSEKVFKLKQAQVDANVPLVLEKRHRLKGDATTFRLYPGVHRVAVQVNGVDRAAAEFDLKAP